MKNGKKSTYTHLKIVFGKNPKTVLPEYNCNQDLVFRNAKNQTGFSISAVICENSCPTESLAGVS